MFPNVPVFPGLNSFMVVFYVYHPLLLFFYPFIPVANVARDEFELGFLARLS